MDSAERTAKRSSVTSQAHSRTWLLALILPLVAAAVQLLIWPYIRPFAWLLFYPATLACSWIDGRRGALIAAPLSLLLVVLVFMPRIPDYPRGWVAWAPALIFILISIAVGETYERWRNAEIARREADEQRHAAILRANELERQKVEAELQSSRELLEHLLKSAVTVVYAFDHEQRLTLANPALLTLIGRDLDGVLGRSPEEIFGARASAHVRAENAAVLSTGRPMRIESELPDAQGVEHVLIAERFPLRGAGGAIVGVGVTAQDITGQRNSERELERHRADLQVLVQERTGELALSEQRLRLILAATAEGIIGVDTAGTITFCNAAAGELLGYADGGLIGLDLHQTVHHSIPDGSTHSRSDCLMLRALASGSTYRLERDALWRADGSRVPVTIAMRPMRSEDSSLIGAVVALSDASLREQADADREHARASAERLARVKSEFLANMSHEIRTPLNGVLGLAQLGQRNSAATPEVRAYFDRIVDSGRVLLGIVNDVLDFSKIEAGKLQVEHAPMHPAAVLDDAVAHLREAATGKGIELRIESVEPAPQRCYGDALRTSQVLLNLLSNAVKFTLQGTVTASVALVDGRIRYRICDTGIGMSQDQVERLFTAFEQADGSTTRRFGGTGLGLTITRRLVDLMQGEIEIESTPGKGSCFDVYLPYTQADEAETTVHASSAVGSGRRLAGVRILVADDNSTSQFVITHLLEGEGAHVTAVANGALAVATVRERPDTWDVVLMDVHMPVMDGLEATRHILAIAPHLPVIGQTADALSEDLQRCVAAGMVDQVTKPIDLEALVATVQRQTPRAG